MREQPQSHRHRAEQDEPFHDEPSHPAAEHVATSDDMQRYRIETQHDAWDQHDPISWAWAVIDGNTVIGRGWSGTEDEAREHAAEWRDNYVRGDWNFDA